jgi:Holliday junction resolvase RusA-like endonuclease
VIIELPPPALEFCVYGIPAPKGSKRAFAVRKGGQLTGRVAVVDDSKPALRDWTAAINAAVQDLAGKGAPKLEGPLEMVVSFYLPKPASAPKRRRVWPGKKPDLSKLLRAIEDPMIGVLIRDDAQFIRIDASKHYAEDQELDQRARATVMIWETEALRGSALTLQEATGDRTG